MSEDRSPIDTGESPQAAVERLLRGITEPDVGMLNGGRLLASNAVWICACVTILAESPSWLIYDTPEGELRWTHVADGVEPAHHIDAQRIAGGHVDPAEVLRWLQGSTPDPWSGGAGGGDQGALEQIRHKLDAI